MNAEKERDAKGNVCVGGYIVPSKSPKSSLFVLFLGFLDPSNVSPFDNTL